MTVLIEDLDFSVRIKRKLFLKKLQKRSFMIFFSFC